MDFFDLRQTGEQIQFILDSFQEISDEFNTVKQEVANMPLVKISNATAYNLNNITDSAIYFIPTSVVRDGTPIEPASLEMYSEYVYVIHLQGLKNGNTYKAQYLITPDSNMKMVYYQRNTNSIGEFGAFVNPQMELKSELMNMFKITCWDE